MVSFMFENAKIIYLNTAESTTGELMVRLQNVRYGLDLLKEWGY